jgi:D-glucosaminate-6-phosphate ammonia-lyase
LTWRAPVRDIAATQKVGQAIGDMVGCEMALVTSGCAGAMTLASAAAMAGDDPHKIIQLPDTTGMPCEILIQSNQRYHYDRAWEFAGAKLVEYEPTAEALEKAITHRTVACVSRPEKFFPGSLSIETMSEIAHAHGLYVMVDGAGETYPLDDLTDCIKRGADVQCVAAKYISSSQSSGLALGSADFINKMFLQTFVGFERSNEEFGAGIGEENTFSGDSTWYVRGIGRPQKVDRQEIMGVYMAVKIWMETDHEARIETFRKRSQTIVDGLVGVPGVVSASVDPNTTQHDPHGANIEVDPDIVSVLDLVKTLKANEEAPLWTRPSGPNTLRVAIFGLLEGEENLVVELIKESLTVAVEAPATVEAVGTAGVAAARL